jgi:hypothetical protein
MKNSRIHIQIPTYLKDAVNKCSEDNRRTFSAQAILYLEQGLEKDGYTINKK